MVRWGSPDRISCFKIVVDNGDPNGQYSSSVGISVGVPGVTPYAI